MQAEILALRHQLIVLQRNANDKADYPRDVQNIIRGRVRSNAFVNAKAKIQANVLLSQDQQLRKAREDESLVTARLSRCVGRDFADYCTSDRSGPIATVSVNIQVPHKDKRFYVTLAAADIFGHPFEALILGGCPPVKCVWRHTLKGHLSRLPSLVPFTHFMPHYRARALWISRRRSSAREELAFPDRET